MRLIWKFQDNKFCSKDTNIYIRITSNNEQTVYNTLHVTTQESDYGYKLYIPKEKTGLDKALFEVIIENNGKLQTVKSLYY